MLLTRRGVVVVAAWLLAVGIHTVHRFSLTRVSIHYVGTVPSGLSVEAVVEQGLFPDRAIPMWSETIGVISPSTPIKVSDWQRVAVSRRGGRFSLPTRRLVSLGGYRVTSNVLHMRRAGSLLESLNFSLFDDGPGIEWLSRGHPIPLSAHFFSLSDSTDSLSVDLPTERDSDVEIDFTPVLETQVVAPGLGRHLAHELCDTGRPAISLRMGQKVRLRYELAYQSPAEGGLPVPSSLPATELFLYDLGSPPAWARQEVLGDLRAHGVQSSEYRLNLDQAQRELTLTRVGGSPAVARGLTSLLLVLYTPNPTGHYSGLDCFPVLAATPAE